MKDKKTGATLKMFEELTQFMENNLEKWNSIDEIRRTYDEFTHNLKKIRDLQPELERDLTPVAKELDEKRSILAQRLFPITNILEVYSEDHKPGTKKELFPLNQKKLESLGNRKILKQSKTLYRVVEKYLQKSDQSEEDGKEPAQDIKRYGMTGVMLNDLHSAIQGFESAVQLRKDVKTYRDKVEKKQDSLIKANRKLLKNRLNKLMTVFSGTHPGFYREYTLLNTE